MSVASSPIVQRFTKSLRGATAALIALVLVLVLVPRVAGASPIDDKRREAERLANQISALGDKESALAERYNQANLNANAVQSKVDDAKARLAKANTQASAARAQLVGVAIDAYVRGSARSAGHTATDNIAVAQVYANIVTSNGTEALDQVRAATLQVNEEQAQLAVVQRQAKAAVSDIDARRKDVLRTESALRSTQARVTGELADLVAQAEAARRAAEASRAQALARAAAERAASLRASRSRPVEAPDVPTVVATNPGAQAAVSEALRQVGKPYQWGAAGPDSFDCSGLTLWAWRAAGVSLPHYTGAQYSSTTHISLSQLQPGDLVYNRSMGHMGMYIGNGQMVEAPHTGANVRIVPLRADMTLASRP